ncbi:unnamed protein product [Periconia digitata]|uniref:Uncharacterized protein n=1 Tax=Periconia digitata TaxID=1303443 RepID=A0A9W4UJQ4_9PLEO|nr:unnamed protein product [Periconia digitata]
MYFMQQNEHHETTTINHDTMTICIFYLFWSTRSDHETVKRKVKPHSYLDYETCKERYDSQTPSPPPVLPILRLQILVARPLFVMDEGQQSPTQRRRRDG